MYKRQVVIRDAGQSPGSRVRIHLAGTVVFAPILLSEAKSVIASESQGRRRLRVSYSDSERGIVKVVIAGIKKKDRVPIAREIEKV